MKKTVIISVLILLNITISAQTSLAIKEVNPKDLLYTTIKLNELNTDVQESEDFLNEIICIKSFGYLYFIDANKNEFLWRSNENYGYDDIDYKHYTLIHRNIDGSQVAIILHPERNKLTGYNAQYGIKEWELDFGRRKVLSTFETFIENGKKVTYFSLDNNELLKIDNAGNIIFRSKLQDKIGPKFYNLKGTIKDIKITKDYLMVFTSKDYTYFFKKDNNIAFTNLTAYESLGFTPQHVIGEALLNVKSVPTVSKTKYVMDLLKINDSLNVDASVDINGKIIHPIFYFQANKYGLVYLDQDTNKRVISTFKINLNDVNRKIQLESSTIIPDDVSKNFTLVGLKGTIETGDLILIDDRGVWEIDVVEENMRDINNITLERFSDYKYKYISIDELYKKNILNKSEGITFNKNIYTTKEYIYFILSVDKENDNSVVLGALDLFTEDEDYKYFSHGEISYSNFVSIDQDIYFLNSDNEIVNAELVIDKNYSSRKTLLSNMGFNEMISGISNYEDNIIVVGEKSIQLRTEEVVYDTLDILPSSRGIEFLDNFTVIDNKVYLLSTDGKLNICSFDNRSLELVSEKYVGNDIDVESFKKIKEIRCIKKESEIFIFLQTTDKFIIYKYNDNTSIPLEKIIDIDASILSINTSGNMDFDFLYDYNGEILLVSFQYNEGKRKFPIENLYSNIKVVDSIEGSRNTYNTPLITDKYVIIPRSSGLDLYDTGKKAVTNTIDIEDRVKSSMLFYNEHNLLLFFDEHDRANFIQISETVNKLIGRYKIEGQINVDPFYLDEDEHYIVMQANDGTFYLFNIERLI